MGWGNVCDKAMPAFRGLDRGAFPKATIVTSSVVTNIVQLGVSRNHSSNQHSQTASPTYVVGVIGWSSRPVVRSLLVRHYALGHNKQANGQYSLWALSCTRRNAVPGTTQVFFASFSPTQLSFSRPAPRCLNSKCICVHLCAHERAGLKTRCVQAHCWRVAILRHLKTAPLTN